MGFQQVRRAVRVEVPRLADTLQAAFDGYPWTDWAFPANERAERVRDCFALYLAASITGQGEVWTTDNHACVAMWQRPVTNTASDASRSGPTLSQTESRQLRASTAILLAENAETVAAADAAVGAHHPPWPHWFLGSVGTRPEFRRRGLARAVLSPVLRQCDQDGLEAVLDTSTRSNVELYAGMGFRTTAELHPAPGAPTVWVMVRNPRSPRSPT